MKTYIDKNRNKVEAGHILFLNENEYGKPYYYGAGIHVVIEKDGNLFGTSRVYNSLNNKWEEITDEEISLEHYTFLFEKDRLCDSVIIGHVNENPEMLTAEWTEANFPFNSPEVNNIPENAKLVSWKDGFKKYVPDGITWEYEADEDWESTILVNGRILESEVSNG